MTVNDCTALDLYIVSDVVSVESDIANVVGVSIDDNLKHKVQVQGSAIIDSHPAASGSLRISSSLDFS
jgi:hypothetical protein